ncbi:MAG TPA: hypothetical protein VL354_03805, partial [Spirochaetia bacterium]|nr:hypothetical protein [Spirochaetia bacterium]
IVPQAGGTIAALWFLNGELVSSHTVSVTIPPLRQDGTTVIGGQGGFTGVIDEFGVYYRDDQGKSSADPAQLFRAMQRKFGKNLVLASEFEGAQLPQGMTLEGKAVMNPGSLTLSPDSALVLAGATVAKGSVSYTVGLSPDSSKMAVIRLQWQGDSTVLADVPVAADSGELKLKVTAGSQSLVVSSSAGDKTLPAASATGSQTLIVRLVNPQTARTPVIALRVLAVRDKS